MCARERCVALVLDCAEYRRRLIQIPLGTSLTGWWKEKAEMLFESRQTTEELGNPMKGCCFAVL